VQKSSDPRIHPLDKIANPEQLAFDPQFPKFVDDIYWIENFPKITITFIG
jgi:hypothetical protein